MFARTLEFLRLATIERREGDRSIVLRDLVADLPVRVGAPIDAGIDAVERMIVPDDSSCEGNRSYGCYASRRAHRDDGRLD